MQTTQTQQPTYRANHPMYTLDEMGQPVPRARSCDFIQTEGRGCSQYALEAYCEQEGEHRAPLHVSGHLYGRDRWVTIETVKGHKIHLCGLNWGYKGEGPRALHYVLRRLGVETQDADHVAFAHVDPVRTEGLGMAYPGRCAWTVELPAYKQREEIRELDSEACYQARRATNYVCTATVVARARNKRLVVTVTNPGTHRLWVVNDLQVEGVCCVRKVGKNWGPWEGWSVREALQNMNVAAYWYKALLKGVADRKAKVRR